MQPASVPYKIDHEQEEYMWAAESCREWHASCTLQPLDQPVSNQQAPGSSSNVTSLLPGKHGYKPTATTAHHYVQCVAVFSVKAQPSCDSIQLNVWQRMTANAMSIAVRWQLAASIPRLGGENSRIAES
eukprot:scpid16021/ scgid22971/ 